MVYMSLLLLLVCALAVFGFLGYGGQTFAGGLRRRSAPEVVRGGAALAAAVAAGAYGWGLVGVAGVLVEARDGGTGSAPVHACRTPGGQTDGQVTGVRVDWLPLGVVCETGDGGSHGSGAVPACVTPLVLAFGPAAAGGAVCSAYAGQVRVRRRQRNAR
ncbi:hypothetical protein AB0L04_03545 [Streptomyces glaucescens]|uniref:hypothetical protein n=1 Tax=Streptomyces glaucescens TaxID=1907 RepID=UPI00344BF929